MSSITPSQFHPALARRKLIGHIFATLCAMMALVGIFVLIVLLTRVMSVGWAYVNQTFLSNFPSVLYPERAGIRSAIWGSIWLMAITAIVAVPMGIGAAIYLQEYARRNRFTRFVQLNIANLAGVPSIVYGILGLAIFVRQFQLDRSILAGGLTMALMVLPVIIIASQEALIAVPDSIRQAAYALGATRWQVVRYHLLPAALPGMMTGLILALSRAIGEAAPLIVIGSVTFVAFVPQRLKDSFTALPIQIYNWSSQPQQIFHHLAAAAIIVLLAMLLSMNTVAIIIRTWQQRKKS
jgi:phosphate transport system permease protein